MKALPVLLLVTLATLVAGCSSNAATESRDGNYELHVTNKAESSVQVRVGIDGLNKCDFNLEPGEGAICRTGVAVDGENHLYFYRADYPGGRTETARDDFSSEVILAFVDDVGIEVHTTAE